MKLSAELRHRIHTVMVHAHRTRRPAESVREQGALGLLGPDVDPQHEVRFDRDTVVHLWVEHHAEAGWCHRLRMVGGRKNVGPGIPKLLEVVTALGLRPVLYETDAVWRARDQSIHVMQPLVRPAQHA